MPVYVIRSGNNLKESLLSPHHLGPKVRSWVFRLEGKHLYVRCHFDGPSPHLLKISEQNKMLAQTVHGGTQLLDANT